MSAAPDALEQFRKDAATFDWFYEMSDSHAVWQRGHAAESAIIARANTGGDEFKRAWNEAHARCYNTKGFCGPYTPPFPSVWPKDSVDNTFKSGDKK